MAITIYKEASPTVGSTEYSFAADSTTLPTKTEDGAFQLTIDANALAVGDDFEITLYETARSSGGTKRVVKKWPLVGVQGEPIQVFPGMGGVILANGWDWTIKKIAGTDRSIPFTLLQIA